MNKRTLIPLLLAGTFALSACGGAPAPAASGASQPPAQSTLQEPAKSVMAPVAAAPDVSEPDVSASSQEGQQPDASQVEPDAGQAPDASAVPDAPPAAVSKPTKVTPKPKPKPQPEPEPQAPDSSGEICGLPLAPADDDPPAEPEPKPAPTKADAQAYIGKSVSSLIAAIGSPKGSDYAPSCLGEGEDGELFYDGFTVYTYRADGKETVEDVV